ncbi:glycine oxidase ThiO [Synechococcus sp. M16CYN]|uniref:glycine oxidase ThiO n=1 Tax=Synechococcus sp. M16CYN TaxID=3103139 RepID=UPI00324B0C0C
MTATSQTPLIVLGGGLMGLAIAHQLARRGQTVQVISRRRGEAAGFVAAGMLAPHAEGLSNALLKLGQLSLERIPLWVAQIEMDSGLSCGLRKSGIVVPFLTATERDAYPTAALGQALDRRQLEQEIPELGDTWQTGLLFEQDGQIDNRRRLMKALERACVLLGVQFLEGVEVLNLECDHQGQLDRINCGVAKGETKRFLCKQAVLCSGAWSQQLVPQLQISPVKGQMLSLQGPREALKRVIFRPDIYLVPREDGLIVVGATNEAEVGFSEGLTPDGQRRLYNGIESLLPIAVQWPLIERWWGFRPCTPDEGPLLGAGPIPGLWLACGHHRNGVLLAAITAELTADVISGVTPDRTMISHLSAFRWDRFTCELPVK